MATMAMTMMIMTTDSSTPTTPPIIAPTLLPPKQGINYNILTYC